MTTYFRTSDASLHELSAETYAALSANKLALLRLWVVDTQPAPSATQVLMDGGIVVGDTEAHQTWALRDKTQAELDAEAVASEGPTVPQLIADIKTQLDIDNTAFNAMTTADKFVVLRQDRRLLLRACRYMLRRMGGGAV
jgi:hypothetical protein